MPTKKATAKIVDVAHPDTVKADATSVPIIVKHGPMLKDPMVAPEAPVEKPADKKEEDSPTVTKVTKIELKPLSADESKEKPKEATDEAEKPAKDIKPLDAPAMTEPKAENDEAEKSTPDLELEESPKEALPEQEEPVAEGGGSKDGPDELLPGVEPTDPAAAKAARETAEKQLALDKLATEGTYFLPINAVEKRKMRTALVLLLVLIVLAAGGALAALDAGFVHVDGFKAPTDFIQDK
jgi:hypothetical protein